MAKSKPQVSIERAYRYGVKIRVAMIGMLCVLEPAEAERIISEALGRRYLTDRQPRQKMPRVRATNI